MQRAVNGIVLIDKPVGLSSNQVLQKVKRIYHAEKAGHTGSLDPLASGMLPICLGEATKFTQYLLDADKYYHAIAQLGIRTTTGDAEGEIIAEQAVPLLTDSSLEQIKQQFIGTIEQVPPMFSALKHQGQPLYKLARKGINIERQARQIQIYSLTLKQLSQHTISLAVHCSKGTYIRSLVEDVGQEIGCGAHLQQLRRLWVNPYQQQPIITLDELQNLSITARAELTDKLLPIDSAIQHLPIVQLDYSELLKVQQGQIVQLSHEISLSQGEGLVRLYCQHDFVGLGKLTADYQLSAQRLLRISMN
jgi:tRNA pseudouridine55 synthase